MMEQKIEYGTFSESKQKLTLTWENINVHLPAQTGGFIAKLGKKKLPARSHIIHDGLLNVFKQIDFIKKFLF